MIGRDACGQLMSVSLPCRPLWVIEIVVLHFTFDLDCFCFEALLEEGQSRDIRWLWTQTNSWRRPALCFNCAFGCLYSSVSHTHSLLSKDWTIVAQQVPSNTIKMIFAHWYQISKGFSKGQRPFPPSRSDFWGRIPIIPWKGPKSAILHCVRQEWFYEQ